MSFIQNCKVCFNQVRLRVTYHNFRHKSLVRPKSKIPKLTRISTHKPQDQIFTERLYTPSTSKIQLNLPKYPGGKLKSDRFLYSEMLKISKKLLNNLHG